MTDTDAALMGRIKKGDSKAFELLLSRHQRLVYNLALRFLNDAAEADDITQEVFIRVYKAAQTYTPDAKFSTWLYTIVKNLCFNVLRSRRSAEIISIEDETLPEIPSKGEDHIERISRARVRELVIRAVMDLPDNMKMVVLLSKYHGLQYDEIAGIMGCSESAVKLRMHRAKAVLAVKLAGLEHVT